MNPIRDWFANSRLARTTEYDVAGSTGLVDDRPPLLIVASSRLVTALSAPTENLPIRPVSLPAP